MDLIPLCACKVNGASFANLGQVTYCQALDSIDGKVSRQQLALVSSIDTFTYRHKCYASLVVARNSSSQ
jgi:hypothetical protein